MSGPELTLYQPQFDNPVAREADEDVSADVKGMSNDFLLRPPSVCVNDISETMDSSSNRSLYLAPNAESTTRWITVSGTKSCQLFYFGTLNRKLSTCPYFTTFCFIAH